MLRYGYTQFYLQTSHTCLNFPAIEHHHCLACTHFTIPQRVEGWVDLGGRLYTEIKFRARESNPDMVTHPSTNRAQQRLTLLIKTNTLLWRQTVKWAICDFLLVFHCNSVIIMYPFQKLFCSICCTVSRHEESTEAVFRHIEQQTIIWFWFKHFTLAAINILFLCVGRKCWFASELWFKCRHYRAQISIADIAVGFR